MDVSQQRVAREYLDSVRLIRDLADGGQQAQAYDEQRYLHAQWQHDAVWLNYLISHHHTRAVSAAMVELSTALERQWDTGDLSGTGRFGGRAARRGAERFPLLGKHSVEPFFHLTGPVRAGKLKETSLEFFGCTEEKSMETYQAEVLVNERFHLSEGPVWERGNRRSALCGHQGLHGEHLSAVGRTAHQHGGQPERGLLRPAPSGRLHSGG